MKHAHSNQSLAATAILTLVIASPWPALGETLPDFTRLVQEASDAVVNISTTQRSQPGMERSPGQLPFGHPLVPRQRTPGRSLGSGLIISKDGYVLTSAHVVDKADTIVVTLSDRREWTAEVVGTDKLSDVALLKVKAEELPIARIGDSSTLKVGQWVLAIGQPFGLDYTATHGIISALGRNLPDETYIPFIQTDVALNPGNSGGPLYDLEGRVVGINSQIFSRSGGYMGLSFAVPINVAMEVADQLKANGRVARGWLGVTIQGVDQDLARSFGLERPRGALVASVMADGPARAAGVKAGDIIVRFGTHDIDTVSELPPLVGRTRVGSTVELHVIRDGQERTLPVEIGELPSQIAQAPPGKATEQRLGLVVAELSADQRKEMDISHGGVVVKEVNDGPAATAGIRPGDVIMKLNGVDVGNEKQLQELVGELPAGRPLPVLILRKGSPSFLALRIPEKQ